MTISSTTNRAEFDGDDSTVTFSFPHYFLAETDLKVYLDNTLQTLTTHYTVTGEGDEAGGSVTMVTPPATGETLVILRDPPVTQATDWVENDPDSAAVKEQAFDKLTMIAQRLKDRIDRSLVLGDSELSTVSTALPSPTDGYVLGWSVVGANTSIVNIATGDDFIPVQASEPDETEYVLWYDTSAEALKYWDGAAWEIAAADVSGKQNRDTDATVGNVAEFIAGGHTNDSGVATASLITTSDVDSDLVPLQRGIATPDTTSGSTTSTSYQTLSNEFLVTPTNGSTKLQGWMYVTYNLSSVDSNCKASLVVGYINSGGSAAEAGTEVDLEVYEDAGVSVHVGVAVLPVNLTSAQVKADGDWSVSVRDKSNNAPNDTITVETVQLVWEEYTE